MQFEPTLPTEKMLPPSTTGREGKGSALDNNCPYCGIIQDESNAVTPVHHGPWDKEVLVLQPIDPAAPGHILVIPRKHVLDSRDAETFAMTCFCASKVAAALYPGRDFNIQLNQGKHAGQTIMHLHLHIVPREEGDGLVQFFTGQEEGHYNTTGKPEHPEHVKPTSRRKANSKPKGGAGDKCGA